jgi:hypothetical protein
VLPYAFADPAVGLFVVLPILLIALTAWGVDVAWRRLGAPASGARRAALATLAVGAGWMLATGAIASTGTLRAWDRTPPPFFMLMGIIVAASGTLAFGRVGARLAAGVPLWALVAVQAFRLPLELAMHRLAALAIMPPQMTYTGRNFDIVTGATAIVVAAVAARRPARGLVTSWNVLGLALLANIVVIAAMSTPPVHYFGADRLNVFVTYPPFVWLPAIMVLAALAGHLVIFRAVRVQRAVSNGHSGRDAFL